MSEKSFRLPTTIFFPNKQINALKIQLELLNLGDQIIQVEDFADAIKRIFEILDSYKKQADKNQPSEQNLPSVNVFCDFDGVIRPRLLQSPFNERLKNILALRKLVKEINSLTLWSSRIFVNIDKDDPQYDKNDFKKRIDRLISFFIDNSGAVSRFPFFTQRSKRRLSNFFKKINSDCHTKFNIGPEKITGKDLFIEKALNILNQNQFLFIIGSSFFDRKRVETLIRLCQQKNIYLSRFYYFDTGKVIF